MRRRFLLFAALFAASFSQPLMAQINQSDSLALVDLYNNTNGPGWKKSTNWLTTKQVSTWQGVTVTGNRVTAIVLTRNQMGGRLPSSIGNLTALTTLSFYLNHIGGQIPKTIGNLVNLRKLELTFNSFSGAIPASIGKLVNLSMLSVNSNKLTDTVPSSIGNLVQLTELYLGNNQLSGKAPEAIGKLVNLTNLDLNLNRFSGEVPTAIYNNLPKLQILGLNDNQFSGPISSDIQHLTSLAYAYMENNQFSGSLPASLGNMQTLQWIDLTNNQLTGVIPSTLSNCAALTTLLLENNKLTGTIPASLATAPKLLDVRVSNNQLSGELAKTLVSGSQIVALYASHNRLTISKNYTGAQGTTNLSGIDISFNAFTFNGLEFIATKVPLPTYNNQDTIATNKRGTLLSVSAGGTLANNTYRWFKKGVSTAVATKVGDSTFQPTESGRYYAKVTNSVATDLTLVSSAVGVTVSAVADWQIAVSPNPAKNQILVSGLKDDVRAEIRITDASGDVWMKAMSRQQATVQMDVSRLKTGAYVVSVSDGKTVKAVRFLKE